MKAVKLVGVVLSGVLVTMAGSTANVKGNTYGDPKAPIVIEVFSDFQCPGCKAFHDGNFQHLMKDYVVPAKVYVVYRYFPLQMHPYGRACSEWACAASRVGKYAQVADALFAQQQTIAVLGNMEAVADSVLTPTEQKTVKSLLKAPDVQKQIDTDIEEGKTVPVPSTPTLWVTAHGKSEVVSGLSDYTLLTKYLDALLKK
jgi:protein-disulfide isomerase